MFSKILFVTLVPVQSIALNLKLPRCGCLQNHYQRTLLKHSAKALDTPVDLLETVEKHVNFMLPTSPRNSWRNVVGLQALFMGAFGILAPKKVLELAHMTLNLDGTLMLFKSMSITILVLGGCMMQSDEDLAVTMGALYFSGMACLLVKAIDQTVMSGSLVETVIVCQAVMAMTLILRTFLHSDRLWDKIRASMQGYLSGTNNDLSFKFAEFLNVKRLGRIFTLRNILFAQCMVFGLTALFIPGVFFKHIFFMLNTPASSSMILFARGLALSSLVLGALIRNRTNEDASKFGVVYFGSLALHALLTCGNPISPVFAPVDTFLTFRSVQECKRKLSDSSR
jgi:hypothetical protein